MDADFADLGRQFVLIPQQTTDLHASELYTEGEQGRQNL